MQTEKEFLSAYRLDDYERPSVTADIAAFMIRTEVRDNYRQDSGNKLCLLLVKRGGHPYKDHWALPGGFLQPGETIEECALREVQEETNVLPVSLMPVGVFSEPGRDPRGWIISHAFASVISEESVKQAGGDQRRCCQCSLYTPSQNHFQESTLCAYKGQGRGVWRKGRQNASGGGRRGAKEVVMCVKIFCLPCERDELERRWV